jgi:hypothetical protein
MKQIHTRFVVVALVAAGAGALLAGEAAAQSGAHTGGGGGGAGKVSMRDFSVASMGNAILAFPASFRGGVRVAVGDVTGDGQAMLQKLSESRANAGGTFTLTFQGQPTGAPGHPSGHNLHQLGMGAHQLKELRLGLLKPSGDGQMKEWRTYKFTDVTLKRGVMSQSNGKGSSGGTMTITFTGLEVVPAIGSANGGVWKTTQYVNPQTGRIMIGLLLPAVQKIRA